MRRFFTILMAVALMALTAFVADAQMDARKMEILSLINQERAKEGIKALDASNISLNAAAQCRAEEFLMYPENEHLRPDGRRYSSVLGEYHVVWYYASENLAWGETYHTPQEIMDAWMQSPGHRTAILQPVFNHVGIGICDSEDTITWCLEFVYSRWLIHDFFIK
jgi:uncharacterized protein YkwD